MVDLNVHINSSSVSSVLNRDTKQYGKKFLFDNEDDTCWNSDQGDTQHISVKFNEEVRIKEFQLQFQGGFSSKQIDFIDLSPSEETRVLLTIYPEDVNNNQRFKLEQQVNVTSLRLLFLKPTDFFGRVIIYNLSFLG